MEPISIVAIITGVSGLAVAILSSVKHTQCCSGFCSLETRNPPTTQPTTQPDMTTQPITQPDMTTQQIASDRCLTNDTTLLNHENSSSTIYSSLSTHPSSPTPTKCSSLPSLPSSPTKCSSLPTTHNYMIGETLV